MSYLHKPSGTLIAGDVFVNLGQPPQISPPPPGKVVTKQLAWHFQISDVSHIVWILSALSIQQTVLSQLSCSVQQDSAPFLKTYQASHLCRKEHIQAGNDQLTNVCVGCSVHSKHDRGQIELAQDFSVGICKGLLRTRSPGWSNQGKSAGLHSDSVGAIGAAAGGHSENICG